MERRTNIKEARQLFGENFIGADEISKFAPDFGVQLPINVPAILYSKSELEAHTTDSILILGVEKMGDGKSLNLMSLRERFGSNPADFQPCFYNQDWYLNEDFMQFELKSRWYLIKKNVFEDSRAVLPSILEKKYNFPQAVLCGYVFFAYWFHSHNILWRHDFVWCSDVDHNGDRIYVGKYVDIDGVNKNGFSIHRHLALRNSYAAISLF